VTSIARRRPLQRLLHEGRAWLSWLGLSMAAVVALTGAGLALVLYLARAAAAVQIQGTAELKAQVVGNWVRERQGDLNLLSRSPIWGDYYQRWRGRGNEEAGRVLLQRMEEWRAAYSYDAMLLLDEHGTVLWRSAPGLEAGARVQAVVAEGSLAKMINPYASAGRVFVDFVVRLPRSDGGPPPALVLRADAQNYLMLLLSAWNSPVRSGDARMSWREGDAVFILRAGQPELGERREVAHLVRAKPYQAAVQMLSGRVPEGVVFDVRDLSGQRYIVSGHHVPGSGWMLIAGRSYAQILGEALLPAAAVGTAGLLGALAVVGLSLMRRHRQALAQSESVRQAQASRLEALTLLETVVEAMGDAIIVRDLEQRVLVANREAEHLSGLQAADLVGQVHPQTLLAQDHSKEILAACRRAVAENVQVHIPDCLQRTAGGTRLLDATTGPLHDAQGAVNGHYLILRDLTEQRRNERALRESEQRLALSLDGAGLGSWEWQIPSDTLRISERSAQMMGLPQQAVMPRQDWLQRVHPDDLQALGAAPPDRFDNEVGMSTVEFRIRHQDGGWVWLHSAGRTIGHDAAGHPLRAVGIHMNITERKRQEEELRAHREHLEAMVAQRTAELVEARARAEEGSWAKSRFVANMSHEIRTPMNSILGLAGLLRQQGATPAQALQLDKIVTAGRHLLDILNDILDLSKIEANKLALEVVDFSLPTIMDQVRSITLLPAEVKGLALTFDDGAPAVPAWLRGDPTRLRQAMLNYVGNALKFTERGSVAVRVQLVRAQGETLLLRFEVEDTGPGLEPRQLERLFDSFEQGDASTTRRHGGTGLGLAIVRRLAVLMGGEAGVDSALGRGSRFWFTAQLQRGTAQEAAPQPEAANAAAALREHHAGARVLLAEDNEVNRMLGVGMLEAVGLQADTAVDGEQAVRKVLAAPPALVLMDIQMPGMDGLAATREIRSHKALRALPIVAMTASAFSEDRTNCLAAGMNDFVTKPVDPPVLYAKLLHWLDLEEATLAAGWQGDGTKLAP